MNTQSTESSDPTAEKKRRVVVLGMGDHEHIASEAHRLRPMIEQRAEIVVWDLGFSADLDKVEADFAIVFGGDGSILRAARQMAYHQRPIVGVNLGKLGFLADLLPDEFEKQWPNICAGQYEVVDHMMFHCQVIRQEKVVRQHLGLNEVAVFAGPDFGILDVDLYIDQELATTYSCDGLIISTPVGSTAHSLSAGGPILRKNLSAFVISPISPHTLTNRPVVDTASRTYEMVVARPNEGTAAVADGQVLCRLEPGDRVRVERAEPRFQLIEVPGHGYYQTLREKLGWGGKLT